MTRTLRILTTLCFLAATAVLAKEKEKIIEIPSPSARALGSYSGEARIWLDPVLDIRPGVPANNVGFYQTVMNGTSYPLLGKQRAAEALESYLREGLRANNLLAPRREGAVRLQVELYGMAYGECAFFMSEFGTAEIVFLAKFAGAEGDERRLLVRALHMRPNAASPKNAPVLLSYALDQAVERLIRSESLDACLSPSEKKPFVGETREPAAIRGWLAETVVSSPSLGAMPDTTPDLSAYDSLRLGEVSVEAGSHPEEARRLQEAIPRETYLRLIAECGTRFDRVSMPSDPQVGKALQLDVVVDKFEPTQGGVRMLAGVLYGPAFARNIGNGRASGRIRLKDGAEGRLLVEIPFRAEESSDVPWSFGYQIARHAARLLNTSKKESAKATTEVSWARG